MHHTQQFIIIRRAFDHHAGVRIFNQQCRDFITGGINPQHLHIMTRSHNTVDVTLRQPQHADNHLPLFRIKNFLIIRNQIRRAVIQL